jgi:heterodisulfide reductase subunit A2
MDMGNSANGKPRIGVYVCHCGTNIAGRVDVEDVARYARTLPGVVVARAYRFMCSDPGQELIRNDIRELHLERVVVASCSPLLHENTFRRACADAGLNAYHMQMANIREQVSWVTQDPVRATEKARALVSAAVRRVALHQALERQRMPACADVMVVGGGIAGIHAALLLANAGKKVYLVERQPSIGGHMAQFDKTFPTLDCAACILTPKMSEVRTDPNITMWTYSEVTDVSGYVGNFRVTVTRKPRYVREDLCVGCADCIDACVFRDARVPDEFNAGLSKRKPIYMPFPQATPLVAVIDPETCRVFTRGECNQRCAKACEREAIDLEQKPEIREVDVGAVILATGYQVMDPARVPEYGYGRYPNVFSMLELERLVNAAGPTGGQVVLRNGDQPKTVGIIHCVGSRDRRHHAYCSSVCCMASLKTAHLVKERTGAEVFNFYIDIRAGFKGYEEFFDRVLGEGVQFVRGRVAEVTDWAVTPEEEGKLVVRVEDTLTGIVRRIPFDMIVLATAMETNADSTQVQRMFNISCSRDGFFLERHPKLAPVTTFSDGIFLAGACQGPKDIPACVAQAGAAAAEALSLVDKGYVEIEPNTAWIDAEACSGCKTCIPLCPFQAISRDGERKVAVVNQALCKGCGTCVAACPSGAAGQNLFTDEEIYQEIEGVLAHA